MSELLVTDRDGVLHRIAAPANATLMEILRDADVRYRSGFAGACSRAAPVHVYLESAQQAPPLAAASEDEAALAAGLRHHIAGRSRIACQIPLISVPDGLRVTVAPEE